MSTFKAMAAGMAGGLVGSWLMTQIMSAAAQSKQATPQEPKPAEDPTAKVADWLSRRVRGKPLREEQKPLAGALVHYAFGTGAGALYGVLAERRPEITRGKGVPYGAAIWAGADELLLPLLRLTPPPWRIPGRLQAFMLALHLIYGATLESVRGTLREEISPRLAA